MRAGGTLEGTVALVNDGEEAVDVLAASRPDVYLTQAGRRMTRPLPRDEVGLQLRLAPGDSHELRAAGSLAGCGPGRYEIRAALPIAGGDPAVGGPWALEVVGTR